MTALDIISFSGWELVGFGLWSCIVGSVWWWGRGESQERKDREFARRHPM